MLLIFPIAIFIVQITICAIGCASKAHSTGSGKPGKFKSKTSFHVKGDTEVSKNGTVVTAIPHTVAPSVSKVGDVPVDTKLNNPEVMKEEKKTEQENGKSQKTERKVDKKPLISVEPLGDLVFKMESESQARLTLRNTSDQKIMFKIKVSDHAYNVYPVFGTLEVGESSNIVVTHTPSQCKEAKIVIVNSKYVGEIDLAKSFRNSKPTGGPITIQLIAA